MTSTIQTKRFHVAGSYHIEKSKTNDENVKGLFSGTVVDNLDDIRNYVLKHKLSYDVSLQDGTNLIHAVLNTTDRNSIEKIIKIVDFLLSHNVSSSRPNQYGIYPMHLAAGLQSPELIKMFLNKGAQINVYDSNKMMPLHYAVRGYATECDNNKKVTELIPENIDEKKLKNKNMKQIISTIINIIDDNPLIKRQLEQLISYIVNFKTVFSDDYEYQKKKYLDDKVQEILSNSTYSQDEQTDKVRTVMDEFRYSVLNMLLTDKFYELFKSSDFVIGQDYKLNDELKKETDSFDESLLVVDKQIHDLLNVTFPKYFYLLNNNRRNIELLLKYIGQLTADPLNSIIKKIKLIVTGLDENSNQTKNIILLRERISREQKSIKENGQYIGDLLSDRKKKSISTLIINFIEDHLIGNYVNKDDNDNPNQEGGAGDNDPKVQQNIDTKYSKNLSSKKDNNSSRDSEKQTAKHSEESNPVKSQLQNREPRRWTEKEEQTNSGKTSRKSIRSDVSAKSDESKSSGKKHSKREKEREVKNKDTDKKSNKSKKPEKIRIEQKRDEDDRPDKSKKPEKIRIEQKRDDTDPTQNIFLTIFNKQKRFDFIYILNIFRENISIIYFLINKQTTSFQNIINDLKLLIEYSNDRALTPNDDDDGINPAEFEKDKNLLFKKISVFIKTVETKIIGKESDDQPESENNTDGYLTALSNLYSLEDNPPNENIYKNLLSVVDSYDSLTELLNKKTSILLGKKSSTLNVNLTLYDGYDWVPKYPVVGFDKFNQNLKQYSQITNTDIKNIESSAQKITDSYFSVEKYKIMRDYLHEGAELSSSLLKSHLLPRDIRTVNKNVITNSSFENTSDSKEGIYPSISSSVININNNTKTQIIYSIVNDYKNALNVKSYKFHDQIIKQQDNMFDVTKFDNNPNILNNMQDILFQMIAKASDKIIIEHLKFIIHTSVVRTIEKDIGKKGKYGKIDLNIIKFEIPEKVNLRKVIDSLVKVYEDNDPKSILKNDKDNDFKRLNYTSIESKNTSPSKNKMFQTVSYNVDNYNIKPISERKCFIMNPEVIRLLIKNSSDVNSKDSSGNIPLHYAIESQNIPAIRILKKLGSGSMGEKYKNFQGLTPFNLLLSQLMNHSKTICEKKTSTYPEMIIRFCEPLSKVLETKILEDDTYGNNVPWCIDFIFPMTFVLYNHYISHLMQKNIRGFTNYDQNKLVDLLKKYKIDDNKNSSKESIPFIENIKPNKFMDIINQSGDINVLKTKEAEYLPKKSNDDKSKNLDSKHSKQPENIKTKANLDANIKSQNSIYLENIEKNRLNVYQSVRSTPMPHFFDKYNIIFNELTKNIDRKNDSKYGPDPSSKSNTSEFSSRLYIYFWNHYLTNNSQLNNLENIHLMIVKLIREIIIKLNDNPTKISLHKNDIDTLDKFYTSITNPLITDFYTLPYFIQQENYVMTELYELYKHVIKHTISASLYNVIARMLYIYVEQTNTGKLTDSGVIVDKILKHKYMGSTLHDLIKDKITRKQIKSVLQLFENEDDNDKNISREKLMTDNISLFLINCPVYPIQADSIFIHNLNTIIITYYNNIYKESINLIRAFIDNYNNYLQSEFNLINILKIISEN